MFTLGFAGGNDDDDRDGGGGDGSGGGDANRVTVWACSWNIMTLTGGGDIGVSSRRRWRRPSPGECVGDQRRTERRVAYMAQLERSLRLFERKGAGARKRLTMTEAELRALLPRLPADDSIVVEACRRRAHSACSFDVDFVKRCNPSSARVVFNTGGHFLSRDSSAADIDAFINRAHRH